MSRKSGMRLEMTALGALVCAAVLVNSGTAMSQTGFDRRGSDYHRFTIKSGDPAVCAARCEHDAHCRAWSFSYPRTTETTATCWLKSRVPPRVADTCCVSGVRGAGVIEAAKGPVEHSIDRPGGDFRSFEAAPSSSGDGCKTACEGDNRCRAWTYVRPGYIGAPARCYLKSKIPRPRSNPCCISGVVR